MTISSRLRAVTFGVLLFVSSFIGILVTGVILTPVLLVRPQLYRYLSDHIIGLWVLYIVSLQQLLLGIRVHVSGDAIIHGEPAVIMMNHRTRLDWMYLWMVLIGQDHSHAGVRNEKIILKEHLKHIPGAGWAMQQCAFIFIKRNWLEDIHILTRFIDFYSDLKLNSQVVIFPEGTDLTKDTMKKSDQYAMKNNLPLYKHVLHPRTMGVSFVINYMRKKNMLAAVYDITISYRGRHPSTETELLCGSLPDDIYFHVHRHSLHSLPDDIPHWCATCWKQKELRLSSFVSGASLSPSGDGLVTCLNPPLSRYIVAIFYTIGVAAFFIAVAVSVTLCWLLFFQMILFVTCDFIGGLELVQILYYNRYFRPKY